MFEIRQVNETEWEITGPDGARIGATHATYELAVAFLGGMLTYAQLAIDDDENEGAPEGDGLLPESWIADPALCFSESTGDGRDFSGCEWSSRDPDESTMPLMLQTSMDFGHMGAQLAGYIESFTNLGTGTNPGGRGRFYDNGAGRQFRDLLLDGRSFGVSVDPGRVDVDWVCTAEDDDGDCISEEAQFTGYEIIGVTGTPFPGFARAAIRLESGAMTAAMVGMPEHEFMDDDSDGFCDVCVTMDSDGECTMRCAMTAAMHDMVNEPDEMAASARPTAMPSRTPVASTVDLTRPPAEWFTTPEPELGQMFALGSLGDEWLVDQGDGRVAMPLTITDDGRVAGHIAVWGQCHTGYPGTCVTPPPSESAYAHFHVGETITAEGQRLAVGALSASCDHAISRLRAAEAQDHYAHNGVAWSNVRATNGEYGPWVCGALRPGVTAEQVAVLRAGAMSGDWRRIGGALELIAALAVTTPGFPIAREAITASGLVMPAAPRVSVRVEAGEQMSLVASGIVRRCPDCARRASAAAGTRDDGSMQAIEGRLADIDRRFTDTRRTLALIERRTRHLVEPAAAHAASRIR